ncbi:NmrA-like family protein [Phlyctema vagabunda]|uniref:NmrA-like family protein n=1 Tax=Phlyctema vagabunda TaxID=108571 RepID=A0ABR4P7M6_9HELO
MTKLVCIIGITGNQGGSVAQRFLQDPNYHIRGITRDPASPTAKKLAAQGIEIVQADLDDVESLTAAFAGASLIFSVTNYWEPFFRPDCRVKAAEADISIRKYAYQVEAQQGKNIADAAAANVQGLDENGFIASTLSHASKCSKGAFEELYHFDSKADIFPYYVDEKYPELAVKMSCVQTGYFMSSYKIAPDAYFSKDPDGGFQMRFTTASDASVPHLDVNTDMGVFVYAVSQMPPGKSYMAEGSTCSWSEYLRIWRGATKAAVTYKQVSVEEFIEAASDKEFGRELGDMFSYSSDPGYDGGESSLLKKEDIIKTGIDCPMTSLGEYMRKADWTSVLSR